MMTHALDVAIEIADIVNGALEGDGTLKVDEAAFDVASRLRGARVDERHIGEALRAEGEAAGLALL